MSNVIEIINFTKRYGSLTAVENLNLRIESGELFGFIGPDGAGKTTTMRTLCTLLPIEQGEMYVAGKDVRKDVAYIRSIVGYMPQRFSLYPDLTVEQNLNFFADLFEVPAGEKQVRMEKLYAFSRLGPFKNRLADALSGGMKQKLALSCILIHTPKILILDEPTTGVDPVSRQEFWEILHQLRDEGVTILVSTPYMDEAGQCDRVAFMHCGKVLVEDKPQNLHRYFPFFLYEIEGENIHRLAEYFESFVQSHSVQMFGDRLHVSFEKELTEREMQRIIKESPLAINNMQKIKPGIEDTFLALMEIQEEQN
ncbi:MAG: ABC transporter ATP-binding protein [Calditrichaeota bacterium]|nr:MAG: ABC transporter ATP-binding protein [Calditrichota bacterium]